MAGKSPEYPELKGRFCSHPFKSLYVERYPWNQATVCCMAWLPTSVGDFEKQSVDGIWNSRLLADIRRSIHDGSYEYCDKTRCPHIINRSLPRTSEIDDPYLREIIDKKLTILPDGPREFMLANDRSCNLSCPSCRTKKIMITSGPDYERMKAIHEKALREALPSLERLDVTGSGDPFASKLYREMLTTLDGSKYPKLKISIVTNGQLLTPRMWEKMHKLHGNIDKIFVSFDASTPEVYRIVRRGGELPKLIENVKHLAQLRKEGKLVHLQLDFVVQALNFRDMPGFVRLGKELGVDRCFFQKIVSWQTYSEEEFPKHAIYLPNHPEHAEFVKMLQDPIFRDPIVHLGNIAEFVQGT